MKPWEKRINNTEMILVKWMRDKGITYTTPEDCMGELIRQGIYPEPLEKARAKAFRDDLEVCGRRTGCRMK